MRVTSLSVCILSMLLSCTQQSSTTVQADSLELNSVDAIITDKTNEAIQVTQQCAYENEMTDLGIGLIIAPSSFEIFTDSLLKKKFAGSNMSEDEGLKICPMFYEPDYEIMHFVCVGETESSYRVLINYKEFGYLPKAKTYILRTWDNYILQSFGIRRQASLPLRQEPEGNSKTITIPEGHEMFCPMEVKGDWVKVKYDCFYNLDDNPHEGEPCYSFIDECDEPLAGWLKWRESNELLIAILLMP